MPHFAEVELLCKNAWVKETVEASVLVALMSAEWSELTPSCSVDVAVQPPLALMIVTFAICNQEAIIEISQSRRSELSKV